jgi:hypothetical protein
VMTSVPFIDVDEFNHDDTSVNDGLLSV